YLMSCVMLFMKDLAPFVQFGVATQLYHMSQSFFSFLLLSNMYCSATRECRSNTMAFFTFIVFHIIIKIGFAAILREADAAIGSLYPVSTENASGIPVSPNEGGKTP
ncbi:MAG: hypothetical protein IKK08_11075, partial [Clostridia bacterium]|nr:hypothetical protein [Clostridia bacterium]